MAPFWFKNVAHETVATTLLFRIAQMEAPKHRNLARVRCHRLYKGPNQQYENYVEKDEQ